MIECVQTISIELTDLSAQICTQDFKQDTPDGVSCLCVSSDQTSDFPLVSMHFPSVRGVVELIASDGSTVLLAATGHIRRFIAQRMNEDRQHGSKANLAPITAKIIAYPTGSAIESDWIVHERARAVDPALYAKINEQNRRSVLVMDGQGGSWRVEDTQSFEPSERELVIGPILTRHAARALGETLDDVYELCRYPKELALAPNGAACAYKQMGRCPGACDGSERMDDYHERFALAMRSASVGIEAWKKQLSEAIQSASEALEFERAQSGKRQLDQVNTLATDALWHAQPMAGMRVVCISPSVRKGWAMVWGLGRDGLVPMVAVNGEHGELETSIDALMEDCLAQDSLDQIWLDRFGLLARHWMTKPSRAKRRRVTILAYNRGDWRSQLSNAVFQACEPTGHGTDDQDDEEQTHIKR